MTKPDCKRSTHQSGHPEPFNFAQDKLSEGSLREILRCAQNDTAEWSHRQVYEGHAFWLRVMFSWMSSALTLSLSLWDRKSHWSLVFLRRLQLHRRDAFRAARHRTFFNCLGVLLASCLCYGVPCEAYAVQGQVLTADKVATMLRHFVLQQGPWQPAQIEVAVRSFPPLPLPSGPVDVQILRPRKGITPGVHSFLLTVEVGGKRVKTVWIRADIQVFDEVMVTSRTLAHAEAITPADVRLERREISALFTRPFTKFEEVAERQAARAIQVNQILTPTMVQLPQVIRSGSLVTLVYESVRLRIEAPGQAVEGGKVGDVIRVKNLSSGQLLKGQVADSREVIIRR